MRSASLTYMQVVGVRGACANRACTAPWRCWCSYDARVCIATASGRGKQSVALSDVGPASRLGFAGLRVPFPLRARVKFCKV